MKQEIAGAGNNYKQPRGGVSVSSSTTPSRLRADSSKPKTPNANTVISSSPKPRSIPVPTNLPTNQRTRRVVLVNKPKPEKGSEAEEVKAVIRPGNRPVVEQFSRPRQRKESDNLGGKKREELVDQKGILIEKLECEVLELKAELEKAQRLNTELQSHNRKISEELAAAEAKIVTLTTPHQRESVEDYQNSRFKDIQKLIATKLENSRVKEAISDSSPARALTVPVAASDIQKNVPTCHLSPLPLPPPPPPPPPRLPSRPQAKATTIPKAPATVEYYHLSTWREQSKYPSRSGNHDKPAVMSAHSSIVGEIQKRSTHLLAIKADIETKGEFVNSLIQKVQDAAYTNIEDIVKFMDWLDTQLSSLADERAVLKHFKWPEKKADAMREAAVEYRSLKLLESEISSCKDETSIPCGVALKKMAGLLDKSEQSIQRLIKLRNSAVLSYKHFRVPTEWMLDSGIISKIKQASMLLAKFYMKRVTMELESVQCSERESTQEGLLLQGVHFAYRAHQFAGGLDSETLCAFEEIRRRVPQHLRESHELLAGILSS